MCILVQKWPSVAWFACIGCDLTLVVMKLVLLDFRVSIVTAGCWKGSSTSGRTIAPEKWFTWTLRRGRCRSNMRSERERGKCGSSFSAWKHSKAWTRILPRQRTMGTIHGRSGCGRKRAKCFGKACLSGRDVRAGDSKSRGNRSRRKNCSEWGTGQGRSLWENTSSRPRVLDICLLFLPRRQLWINRFRFSISTRLHSTRFFSSPHRQYRQNLNVWRFYPTLEPRSRNTRRHFRLQIYLSGTNPLAKKGVSCTHRNFKKKMCVVFWKAEARGRSIENRRDLLNDKSWHKLRAKQIGICCIAVEFNRKAENFAGFEDWRSLFLYSTVSAMPNPSRLSGRRRKRILHKQLLQILAVSKCFTHCEKRR